MGTTKKAKAATIVMGVTEFRKMFPAMLREVEFRDKRIILENHGRAVAVLVSLEDLAAMDER
jgi:prevent-host-death family protein